MAHCWGCLRYQPSSLCQDCIVSNAFDTLNNPPNVLNQCMDNLGTRSTVTLMLRTTLMELDEANRAEYIHNLLQNPPGKGLLSCLSGAMTWFICTSVQVAANVMPSNGTSSQAVSIIEIPSTSHGFDPTYLPSHTHTPSLSDGSDPDYLGSN
ncbi:hypothetical protein MTR67_046811 [Solanum verrucosum]|uniref:Uncharacterized protein n=1 Tax=Solanum verrucosum TaxID=315347 RepID=A0AAF0UYM2_SOLVR|nr:hypothetical protein MTR67_046811 [Solanum verrucosum]